MLGLLRKYSYYLLSIFKLLFGFHEPLYIAKIFLNREHSDVKTIRLRNPNLQFRVRGAMDVWSIKETFLDRFYEKYGFTIQPHWNIVDIGAGLGDSVALVTELHSSRNSSQRSTMTREHLIARRSRAA